jgi:hypothetical protein
MRTIGSHRSRIGRKIAALPALTLTMLAIGASPALASVYTFISVSVSPTGSSTTGSYYDTNVPYPQSQPAAAVSIVHNGAVAATQSGPGDAYLTAAPVIGDTVRIEQPPGNPIDSIVYNLSVDPSTCIGAKTISGQRSDPGAQVFAYAFVPSEGGFGTYTQAQITTLSGSTYAGTFSRALTSSDVVSVGETASFTRAYGYFEYDESLKTAVGACPQPPPPANVSGPAAVVGAGPPPPPAKVSGPAGPRPPTGSISVNARRALRSFFHKGLTMVVSVDQPGKVVENMFLANGKLPGKASTVGSAKSKRKHGATLIGRGSSKVAKAGAVKVTVRPTRAAKRLRRKRALKVQLLTTLSNLAGQTTTLPPKRVTLKR